MKNRRQPLAVMGERHFAAAGGKPKIESGGCRGEVKVHDRFYRLGGSPIDNAVTGRNCDKKEFRSLRNRNKFLYLYIMNIKGEMPCTKSDV
ncbi:MAG: hypothetical protein EOM90_07975 [Alphaproteobacteria bacterium]|nr:hypothetical protein [Alphaproteobacteria bacterium]